MSKASGYVCRPHTTLTPAGTWALYFYAHPDELPVGAPDPRIDAAAFAEWVSHNLPELVRLKASQP